MRVGAFSLFAFVAWSGQQPPSMPDATLSGHVYIDRNGNGTYDAGERGLRGVAVSNQDQVVVSDANGAYRLPGPGSTGIVFASIPNGYASRGAFYRSIDSGASNRGPMDFAMTPVPATPTVTFIHASDTHIANASLPRTKRFRALIDSIRPAFVIVSGDLVRDALRVGEAEATGYYELLQREMALIAPPVWTVPGNHEAFGIDIPFFSSMESVHGLKEAPPAPSVITIGGKAQFRHTVSNAAEVIAKLKGHPYPLALAGHVHVRERLRFEGTNTRFEQSAAIVAPTPAAGVMFTSGITVYRITGTRIDDGRFVPLGLDHR